MIRSIKRLVLAGVAAAALTAVAFAGPASASVSIDPATGSGFVGKGDVQTAFGWNNAKLQAKAANLRFSMVSTETWGWDEEWDTSGKKEVTHHEISKTRTTSVNGVVAYDTRQRNQVTGINLTGFKGSPVISGGYVPQQNGEVTVDRQSQREPGDIYPTDTIATNIMLESSSGSQLYVSRVDASGNVLAGPVAIPAPVAVS